MPVKAAVLINFLIGLQGKSGSAKKNPTIIAELSMKPLKAVMFLSVCSIFGSTELSLW